MCSRLCATHYQFMLEAVREGVVALDSAGSIRFANNALAQMLGYPAPELTGQALEQLLALPEPPQSRPRPWEQPAPFQAAFRHRNGTVLWAEITARPLPAAEAGEAPGWMLSVLDLSQQRQTATLLAASSTRLQTILDTIPDAAWLKDPDGRYLAVNQAWGRLFGLEPARVQGLTGFDFLPRELAERFAWDERNLMALGRPVREEEPVPDNQGGVRWFETWKTPVLSEAGQPMGTVGIARDITERKRTEQKLQAAAAEWQTTFDAIQDCVLLLDKDGGILRANAATYAFLQLAPEAVLGRRGCDVLGHEHLPGGGCPMPAMLASLKPEETELFDARRGLWLRVTSAPILDGGGRLTGIVHTLKNISKRKQAQLELAQMNAELEQRVTARTAEVLEAQHQLRQAEERWRFALEGSGDGVWDWNPQTGSVHFSAQWKRMLGYEPGELGDVLSEWKSRIHPEDRERVLAAIQQLLDGASSLYLSEHRLRCKDGSWKWILDRGKVMQRDAAGQPVRIIGTHSDITERKNAELQMEEALRREREASETKSRFISMSSHQFRTPLAAIQFLTDTLAEHFERLSVEQRQAKLVRIQGAVDRMRKLLEQVLAISRMDAGRLRLVRAEVDLVAFLHTTLDECAQGEGAKHHLCLVHDTPQARVSADREALWNIVANLLRNAVSYSPPATEIRVELRHSPQGLELAFSDQGMGIPAQDQGRVFEAFERGSNVGSIKGSGLGLSIVKRLVELHGWTIGLSSGPGAGTRFTIVIPSRPPP